MSLDYDRYVKQWQPDFRSHSQQYKDGPVQDRPCRDTFCLVIFFIILGGFLFIGIYSIKHGVQDTHSHSQAPLVDGQPKPDTPNFADLSTHSKQILIVVALMTVLSFVSAFVFILLLKSFPRCMVYLTMLVSALALVFIALIAFLAGHFGIGAAMIALLLIYVVVLCCCFKQNIDATIILLRLTAQFLSTNCSVYLTPVGVGLVGILMAIFALSSINGISLHVAADKLSESAAGGLTALHLLFYFFFMYFLYYVMVFLIATAAGDWYFQRQGGCWSGVKRLVRGHIGSLTFASSVITIVKVVQAAVDTASRNTENACSAICLCMVKCFLNILEGLVHTLNHFAIIVMTYTGQGFVNSAKQAGIIVFSNIGLFSVLNSACSFIFFTGLLFSTLIPTLVSIPLAKALGINHDATAIAVIVFLVSILVSCVFLCSLTEALMSIYVFSCFDRQLQQYGVRPVPLQQRSVEREELIGRDLSGYQPNELLNVAYPYISNVPYENVAAPQGVNPNSDPFANPYQPEQPAAPVAPLYQPYNSGVKPNYGSRQYNAPQQYQRESSGGGGYPQF